MSRERTDIPEIYKWDLEAMYSDAESCEKDLKECVAMAEKFTEYRGSLDTGPKTLLSAFKDMCTLSRKLEKAFTYAMHKKDEDNRVSQFQALAGACMAAGAKVSEQLSFFEPELSEIPEEKLREWIESEEGLKVYAHSIDELIRKKPHILSKEEEKILASLSEISWVMHESYSMLCDADFSFGSIEGADGEEIELTHGNYVGLLSGKNRDVRKRAYERMYEMYKKYMNTISTLYSYSVRQDVASARIRKYPSALEASVFDDNVPREVYDNLIDVVNENLHLLHRYVALRKRMLALEDLAMYDIYVPILDLPEKHIEYEEAKEIIDKALIPLGEEYRSNVRMAFESRWTDVYETPGKTSGAYSGGCYDSAPYMLLNYDNKLDDVFTVIHEMGHSMQSWYSNKNQEYINARYPIFTAEVASTVNESLLYRYLIANAESELEEAYLINQYLDGFKGTMFRQTQFAEFEREVHARVEAGDMPTGESLSKLYGELNAKYYGPDMNYDELIAAEWARIPHFYRAFYVYKYATGHAAATAISSEILEEGEPAAEKYIEFLKSGGSDYPLELLKLAGVDMSSPEPIRAAMRTFEALLTRLEEILK
ncbi:MAG: oligoendopeptidase F [Clostridiales bacterium]|nr:oligoendopeptidase F [Clostridiales bacterium]